MNVTRMAGKILLPSFSVLLLVLVGWALLPASGYAAVGLDVGLGVGQIEQYPFMQPPE